MREVAIADYLRTAQTRVPDGGSKVQEEFIVLNECLLGNPEYTQWDMITAMNMGLTAEKLFEETDFTRDDLDRFGVRSHRLASKAQEEGSFDEEISPVEAEQADGEPMLVNQDQAVLRDTSFESLSALKPAF